MDMVLLVCAAIIGVELYGVATALRAILAEMRALHATIKAKS